jgi:hypothetical protein
VESNSKLTDSEKIEQIRKDLVMLKRHSYIQTAAVILAFIGIVSIHQIAKKK